MARKDIRKAGKELLSHPQLAQMLVVTINEGGKQLNFAREWMRPW